MATRNSMFIRCLAPVVQVYLSFGTGYTFVARYLLLFTEPPSFQSVIRLVYFIHHTTAPY